MKTERLKRIEKICIIIIACLVIVVIACIFIMISKGDPPKDLNNSDKLPIHEEIENTQKENEQTVPKLTQKLDLMPSKCNLYNKMPEISFITENNEELKLSDLKGKVVVITFWASWCKHCQAELAHSKEFYDMLNKYKDVEFLLVDKLDESKETKEQALAYLKENNIPFKTVFDENLLAYKTLGIKAVPTTLIIDKNGILTNWHVPEIEDSGKLEALIKNDLEGNSYATEKFIKDKLTNSEGGIMTSLIDEGSKPTGRDVLSESQGIMLQYAALKNNKDLFNNTLDYVNKYMKSDNLTSWVVEDGTENRVNSVLDDLRIYGALNEGSQKFGEYDKELIKYRNYIYKYNVNRNNLVDSYDFKYKEKSNRLSLCYADFRTLKDMSNNDSRFKKIYSNSLETIKGGYINDKFPFYYNYYDYKNKVYDHNSINSTEGMMTLWHLAEIGELPDTTVTWIKDTIKNTGILGRYNVDGSVVKGYEYESTAVYAIAVLISNEVGDDELTNLALGKMTEMRINNTKSELNGAFGNEDGTGIYSFNQCMALIAYGKLEEKEALNNHE